MFPKKTSATGRQISYRCWHLLHVNYQSPTRRNEGFFSIVSPTTSPASVDRAALVANGSSTVLETTMRARGNGKPTCSGCGKRCRGWNPSPSMKSNGTRAIDKVRAAEAKQRKQAGYEEVLKGGRWLLLMRPGNPSNKQAIKTWRTAGVQS